MSSRPTRPGSIVRPIVKICGVTRPEDARLAVDLGADLLGLNFYPRSPRYLADAGRAREIAAEVRGETLLVGVFVEREPVDLGAIDRLAERVGLDLVQLHGDRTGSGGNRDDDPVAALGRRALRVFRREEPPAREELSLYHEHHGTWGFLFDLPRNAEIAPEDDPHGGTGRSWDFAALAPLAPLARRLPILVAGGIGPDNAARALAASRASGIDVCSRIESSPGVKDPHRMRQLFEETRDGTNQERA